MYTFSILNIPHHLTDLVFLRFKIISILWQTAWVSLACWWSNWRNCMCSCQDSMATRCRSSLLLGHASSRRHYHTIVQIDIDSLCSQLVLVTGFQLVHKFLNSFTLFFCQGLCLVCWPNIYVFSIVCCQLIFIPIFIVIAGSSAFVWSSTTACSFLCTALSLPDYTVLHQSRSKFLFSLEEI